MHRTAHMIPTGCGSLDELLNGGLPPGQVSLVYGEAETGKTCLAIQCTVNAARQGCKVIFIDSDGTFSPKRLTQIAGRDSEAVASLITLIQPLDFIEQAVAIDRLAEYLTPSVGLVAVDTVTALYRAEMGTSKESTFKLNRELGRQLACLTQIAKTERVAMLVTSQVHNVFFEGSVNLEPVASRVLEFWSDIVINLEPTGRSNTFKAVLRKHAHRRCPAVCYVSIEKDGICDHCP